MGDYSREREIIERSRCFSFSEQVAGAETYLSPDVVRPLKALQYPPDCRRLAYNIVRHFLELDIHVVAATSVEAILLAAEVSRQLECRIVYTSASRSSTTAKWLGEAILHAGERLLLIDDLLLEENLPRYRNIGKQILAADARLVGIGTLFDFCGGKNLLNIRQVAAIPPDIAEQLAKEIYQQNSHSTKHSLTQKKEQA